MIAQTKFHQNTTEALRIANELFAHKPTWEIFFKQIMGAGGAISTLFKTPNARAEFATTDEYDQIHRMLAELRSIRKGSERRESTRVITVRLPQSMHESLRAEAHEHKTSMNQLCITKLLQVLSDDEFVMSDGRIVRQDAN